MFLQIFPWGKFGTDLNWMVYTQSGECYVDH
jgi:hypothetical protein